MHLILNAQSLHLPNSNGFLLDVLRSHACYSVKAVCREGDCGACQVLIGRKTPTGHVQYRTFNSCLIPVADVEACHIITTEGLHGNDIHVDGANALSVTPIQKAMLDAEAIQCGYCTPGFVMALTGWLLNESCPTVENALDWLSGNLCRCTGYMGMRRAIDILLATCPPLAADETPFERAVRWGLLPPHYASIAERLPIVDSPASFDANAAHYGGATDLAVENAGLWFDAAAVKRLAVAKGIHQQGGMLRIGAGTDIESMRQSPLLRRYFPAVNDALTLFASRPIRHQATVGGNIAHASPSADLAVMLLALKAEVVLQNTEKIQRTIDLKDFFTGYKQTSLQENEWIESVLLPLPSPSTITRFHFEKVSKRIHQDIASASVALAVTLKENRIASVGLAVGGVAPVPLSLCELARPMAGYPLQPDAFVTLALRAKDSVTPINDVRGSSDYKRALIERLIIACAEALTTREDS